MQDREQSLGSADEMRKRVQAGLELGTGMDLDESGIYMTVASSEVVKCDDPTCTLLHVRLVPGFMTDTRGRLAVRMRTMAEGIMALADHYEREDPINETWDVGQ